MSKCKKILALVLAVVLVLSVSLSSSFATLLPLEEVKAYLVLSDYSSEELAAMPVDTILTMFQDSEGNYIEIDSSATTVWRYVKDDTDGVEMYEEYAIGNGETLDLSVDENISAYTMELIVGSGAQLDSNNVRYIVKVYLLNTVTEEINYELYTQDENGNREEIIPSRIETSVNSQLGMSLTTTMYAVSDHVEGTEYYLGFSSLADEHPDVRAEIFTYTGFVYYLYGLSADSITNQILNQDMTQADAGYLSSYDAPDGIYDTQNMFFIAYLDTFGNIISYSCVAFVVAADISYVEGNIYSYEDGEMTDVICTEVQESSISDISIDLDSGSATGSGITGLYYMLNEGYSVDDEYYCVLNAHGTTYGDDANSYVSKAVVGRYDSLEDAANQEDIKDELIPVDQTTIPYGYKENYSDGIYFTVFFEDGSVYQFLVLIMEYDSKYDEGYVKSFTSAPIIGEADPWFRVTGASTDGEELDTYVVENGSNINLDTMYGYGYQTIFINDEDVDLSELQPIFWTADANRIDVYVNGEKIESGDTVDCSAGTVQFSVIIDDNVKNYIVSFVKKTSDAQLYICGPETQEVFLDEYFEYKHDILTANIGNEELTGLYVELDATNCKLDEYWTVGGDSNDTLAAFTSTSSNSEYGYLSNLAKIRLVPDGEGEIEGTLTIYANELEEPIVITLTGRAQNPKLVTTGTSDAVKYVPYSYLIATNNMYDWTDVTFTMIDGELPEGLELYETTGEIYGVPQETGEFTFTVQASFTSDTYTFDSSEVELTLTVVENTNENVYNATDEGYEVLTSVGEEAEDYDFVLTEYEDTEFRSEGVLEEFIDLWLNGEKLVEGEDYSAESGSTRITIYQQTFANKASETEVNTLAAEFREDGDTNNTLKKTAQNFRLDISSADNSTDDSSDSSSGGSSSGGSSSSGTSSSGTSSSGTSSGGSSSSSSSSSSGSSSSGSSSSGSNSSGTSSSGTSSGGSSSSGTSSSGGSSTDITADSQTVTFRVRLVDDDGNAITDLSLELHSTVQNAVTNSNGYAVFDDVDFGSHTLSVLEDGNAVAAKTFTLQSGNSSAVDGNIITAAAGSTVTLTVQYDSGELTFVSVATAPQTGDATMLGFYIFLMSVSGLGLGVIVMRTKKRQSSRFV